MSWPAPRELLPHGPAAVFVERVLEQGEHELACRIVPGTADAAHAEGGLLPAALAVEYIAQAIGLFAELRAPPGERRAPGFVIAIRDLELVVQGFTPGVPLVARVKWQGGDDRLAQFEGRILRDDDAIARAVLTVFRPAPGEVPG